MPPEKKKKKNNRRLVSAKGAELATPLTITEECGLSKRVSQTHYLGTLVHGDPKKKRAEGWGDHPETRGLLHVELCNVPKVLRATSSWVFVKANGSSWKSDLLPTVVVSLKGCHWVYGGIPISAILPLNRCYQDESLAGNLHIKTFQEKNVKPMGVQQKQLLKANQVRCFAGALCVCIFGWSHRWMGLHLAENLKVLDHKDLKVYLWQNPLRCCYLVYIISGPAAEKQKTNKYIN